MIEIMNYTTDTAHEFSHAGDLADYIEEHQHDEIGVSHCSTIAINSLDEAELFLSYTDEQRNQLKLVQEVHGYSYYDNLEEALEGAEAIYAVFIDGATSLHQLAHELNYTIGYEEELNTILGCSPEAYEQLGSFITDDDIAHVINTEYNYVLVDGGAFLVITP